MQLCLEPWVEAILKYLNSGAGRGKEVLACPCLEKGACQIQTTLGQVGPGWARQGRATGWLGPDPELPCLVSDSSPLN